MYYQCSTYDVTPYSAGSLRIFAVLFAVTKKRVYMWLTRAKCGLTSDVLNRQLHQYQHSLTN